MSIHHDQSMRCPNCNGVHKILDDICLLSVLFGVLVHCRERFDDEEAAFRMSRVNVDVLWDDLGEILDALEEGDYDLATVA